MKNASTIRDTRVITGRYLVITNRKFSNLTIADQNISGCKYNNIEIKDTTFIDCEFQSTEITNTRFINCKFVNCNFSFTKFIDCNFITCKIENCDFCITNSLNSNFLSCTYTRNICKESTSLKNVFEGEYKAHINIPVQEMTSITVLSSLSLELELAA